MTKEKRTKLLELGKQNHVGALTELFENYKDAVYFFGMILFKNKREASNLVQKTFVTVFEELFLVEDADDIFAFIMGKVLKQSIIILKRKEPSLFKESITGDGGIRMELPSNTESEYETIFSDEKIWKSVMNVIEKLPLDKRIPALLFYYYGVTIEEMAELFQCSQVIMQSQINYGKAKIQKCFEMLEEENIQLSQLPFMTVIYYAFYEKSLHTKLTPEETDGILISVMKLKKEKTVIEKELLKRQDAQEKEQKREAEEPKKTEVTEWNVKRIVLCVGGLLFIIALLVIFVPKAVGNKTEKAKKAEITKEKQTEKKAEGKKEKTEEQKKESKQQEINQEDQKANKESQEKENQTDDVNAKPAEEVSDVKTTYAETYDTVYTKDIVRMRAKPDLKNNENVLFLIQKGTQLEREGYDTETGFSIVTYKGVRGYIKTEFITTNRKEANS